MAGAGESASRTGALLAPEKVAEVAELAGLSRAFEAFPDDVLIAARIAAEMTTAIRRLGDPVSAPWPPMRPSGRP